MLAAVPPSGPSFDPAALDAYAAKALADWQVPGVALAVVKDDKVLLAKGYGVRAAGKPEPVTDATLFAIASCSKAFTAAAVAILVDEGKVRWPDPRFVGSRRPIPRRSRTWLGGRGLRRPER